MESYYVKKQFWRLKEGNEEKIKRTPPPPLRHFYPLVADVHDRVLECMNLVYLRGCELAYFGEMINKEAFCPKREDGDQSGAGSLVVHIRSGDIFDPEGEGKRRKWFGQVGWWLAGKGRWGTSEKIGTDSAQGNTYIDR